jgi:hypothetical protein
MGSPHKIALYKIFRDYHQLMSLEFENELKNHFKGLKRRLAADAAEGNRAIMPGKSPLFRLNSFLLEETLRADSKEFVFARTFMLISWNLMCRASNAVDIKYEHMGWHFLFCSHT